MYLEDYLKQKKEVLESDTHWLKIILVQGFTDCAYSYSVLLKVICKTHVFMVP